MAADRLWIIGRPHAAAPWIGVAESGTGFRLILWQADAPADQLDEPSGDRTDLLLAALAYFSASTEEPPPELEATQADLAALTRWLAATEADSQTSGLLHQAVDAIDDGLASEAVAAALVRAARHLGLERVESEDPLLLLLERHRARG